MPWHYDCDRSQRGVRQRYSFAQLGIGMKHHVRRHRDAPQDIDFIVIGRTRTDEGTVSCKHLVHM